ncbi:MAG: electron transport complex subunit RsxC [Clostridia bacterium]|nr:electron transport complex subunit RsxC [Clostridia bacterium]
MNGVLTFRGGIHPPHRKSRTSSLEIKKAETPSILVIPMQQHIGAPCIPIVEKGQYVKVGQKLGEAKGFVSAPVHSSVSGIVKEIKKWEYPLGQEVDSIVIESDGNETIDESVRPVSSLEDLSPDEIRQIIREAGIVGMGGATFPTQVKLSPPPEKKIDTVIINGAECEPYLTADHRVMLEKPDDVIFGLKAIMKTVRVDHGYIAIEDNKKDAIKLLTKKCADRSDISVVTLKTKYPQGAEKQLIKAITGKEVPSGGLPMDVGVIVSNVGTACAIANAVNVGMPLVERVVTVTGNGVKNPQNMLVKIGVTFREVIEQCGGFNGTPAKVIMGGPMMGLAQYSIDVPVIKGTSGILVLTEDEAKQHQVKQCIRCARCVDACPVGLMPINISNYISIGNLDEAEKLNVLDCIECGSCSFTCPARRPLLPNIRMAKQKIIAQKRNKK